MKFKCLHQSGETRTTFLNPKFVVSYSLSKEPLIRNAARTGALAGVEGIACVTITTVNGDVQFSFESKEAAIQFLDQLDAVVTGWLSVMLWSMKTLLRKKPSKSVVLNSILN